MKPILSVVLTVGNYLNGGTPKGQADGFDIESLNKLIMVKDSTNKQTLLDYIVKIVKENYPERLVRILW